MFTRRFSLAFLLAVFIGSFAQVQAQTVDQAFIGEKDNFFIDLTDAAATFRDLPRRADPFSLSVHSYNLSYKKGSLSILHDAYDRAKCSAEEKPVDALKNIKAQFANTKKDYVLLAEKYDEWGGFTLGQLTYQTPEKVTVIYKQYLSCSHLFLLSGQTSAASTETDDPVIRAINSFALKGDK